MSQEEMKALLAEAWKEVFKVDEVSDDSDFFEAGGIQSWQCRFLHGLYRRE